MNTSFYNGVSGMKTAQVGIDVWGDNIANIDTIGFKQRDVDFSTLFSTSLTTALNSPATSDVGLADTTPTTVMNLSQGSLKNTDYVFDLALEGQGWFKVVNASNMEVFTRQGSFSRDTDGTLVAQSGAKLQVVSAGNISQTPDGWTFDPTIKTDDLFKTNQPSDIQLPNDITFPAQPTKNIIIGGNLPNSDVAPDPKPADLDSEFGVLYDKHAQNLKIINGDNLVYGFGDNMSYSKNLVTYNLCVTPDPKDNQDMNIDFFVNDTEIKLTVPDGSSSQEVAQQIAQELDKNDINYTIDGNDLQIKAKDSLTIKAAGGDLIKQSSTLRTITYDNTVMQTTPDSDTFRTIQDFVDKLQSMADLVYQDGSVTVGLDDTGKLYIQNNTDSTIRSSMYSTSNSNPNFIENLGFLATTVDAHSHSSSMEFNKNYQGFTGQIVDAEGNLDDLKFDFVKTRLDEYHNVWNVNISEISPDGEVISTVNQDLIFDNQGVLIEPRTLTIDNNGADTTIDLYSTLGGLTAVDKPNSGFQYTQDGLASGHLTGYDVNDFGQIVANFSNSQSGIVGQIPIYHFQNEQGLDNLGDAQYTPTSNSGSPITYSDEKGGYIPGATIKNYTLEVSNVNMGTAMTQLIIIQKAYDANSKSVTTSDELVKRAIDMKR
ncbi:MAG: flagellar hook-basal body complex protein [Epsilonproteobacteria bacterium]|nr:flagellar hook-basal body complex protein [Campylobacterota bacterium]